MKKTRAFNRRASEVRIDYVQHALSAFLAWAILVESTALTEADC